jgi:predicted transcriptional regulator
MINVDRSHLSRRERQVMDILYRRGRATAAAVRSDLPKSPSYSAVRATLRILEEKGHVRHEEEGLRYVFLPKVSRERAAASAVKHLLRTFFDGSAERAVAALLDTSAAELTPEQLERLAVRIEQARKEGK